MMEAVAVVEAVRNLRRALGLSQEQFAHELGVTFSTVSRWENGHTEPSRLAIRAMRYFAAERGVECRV